MHDVVSPRSQSTSPTTAQRRAWSGRSSTRRAASRPMRAASAASLRLADPGKSHGALTLHLGEISVRKIGLRRLGEPARGVFDAEPTQPIAGHDRQAEDVRAQFGGVLAVLFVRSRGGGELVGDSHRVVGEAITGPLLHPGRGRLVQPATCAPCQVLVRDLTDEIVGERQLVAGGRVQQRLVDQVPQRQFRARRLHALHRGQLRRLRRAGRRLRPRRASPVRPARADRGAPRSTTASNAGSSRSNPAGEACVRTGSRTAGCRTIASAPARVGPRTPDRRRAGGRAAHRSRTASRPRNVNVRLSVPTNWRTRCRMLGPRRRENEQRADRGAV